MSYWNCLSCGTMIDLESDDYDLRPDQQNNLKLCEGCWTAYKADRLECDICEEWSFPDDMRILKQGNYCENCIERKTNEAQGARDALDAIQRRQKQ